MVLTRLLACGLLITFATPLRAQQQTPVPAPAPATVGDDEASRKNQVQLFEGLLSGSVISGGQAAADQARKVVPGVLLTLSDQPKVRGWWSPSIGYQYYVELPDLLGTQVLTWTQQMQMRQGTPVNRATGGQGANAQSTVSNDALSRSPVIGSFDLAAAYRDAVYAQLYSVILENSGGLPIKDEELLQVVSAPAPNGANFLFPDSRKLVLQIRGADLRAYHEHRITKDEARQRIVETKF